MPCLLFHPSTKCQGGEYPTTTRRLPDKQHLLKSGNDITIMMTTSVGDKDKDMAGKYSTLMGTRRATIALFTVFFLLVLVVMVIGLNHVAGIICGNLAVGMLYIVMTRRWWRIRNFIILFFAAVVGIIVLSALYVEVIWRIAVAIGGTGVTENTAFRIFDFIINNLILLAGPSGMLVGLIGAATLGIIRLSTPRKKKTATGT